MVERTADAIIRECMPIEDKLSESQARKLYGDRWVRKQIKYRLVSCCKEGNMNVLSRRELNARREAERAPAKIVFKTKKK